MSEFIFGGWPMQLMALVLFLGALLASGVCWLWLIQQKGRIEDKRLYLGVMLGSGV